MKLEIKFFFNFASRLCPEEFSYRIVSVFWPRKGSFQLKQLFILVASPPPSSKGHFSLAATKIVLRGVKKIKSVPPPPAAFFSVF